MVLPPAAERALVPPLAAYGQEVLELDGREVRRTLRISAWVIRIARSSHRGHVTTLLSIASRHGGQSVHRRVE